MFFKIADLLGISVLRLGIYAACVALATGGALTIRQHYINIGWRNHAAAVQKQDNRAIETNKKVEETANKCSETNGFWDVVTQNCKLQEEEK